MKLATCPPFGLSLSKPSWRARNVALRHGAFDKLSPLLRVNGFRGN